MNKSQEQQMVESVRDIRRLGLKAESIHLLESNLSGLWTMITKGHQFAVLSAHVHGDEKIGEAENALRQKALHTKIREMSYGFTPMRGGYRYPSGILVEEDTVLISSRSITKQEVQTLAEADWMPKDLQPDNPKLNIQHSYVFAGKDDVITLIETVSGDILDMWERNFDARNFDADLINGVFSKLVKANRQHSRKWAFAEGSPKGVLIQERRSGSFTDANLFRYKYKMPLREERWVSIVRSGTGTELIEEAFRGMFIRLSAVLNLDFPSGSPEATVNILPFDTEVDDIEDAIRTAEVFRDRRNLGGGNWGKAEVWQDGKKIGRVNCNGKYFAKGIEHNERCT